MGPMSTSPTYQHDGLHPWKGKEKIYDAFESHLHPTQQFLEFS